MRKARIGSPPLPEEVADHLVALGRLGYAIAWPGSETYPQMLLSIPDPPAVLFYRGDLPRHLDGPTVAMVGSRRCSIYGRSSARRLGSDLAAAGVTVVSGLARGIDGEAHRGALQGGGPTVAVMACGPDVVYPPEHQKLLERIVRDGATVTEYLPRTRPERFRFPERNRIISGLCLGVVVVEAGRKSGALITVDCALDQGREVMCVPGEISRECCRGSNQLLKSGAGFVTSAEDVVQTLGITVRSSIRRGRYVEGKLERSILDALAEGPCHFDLLLRRLGAKAGDLNAALLGLEMAGAVVQRPGRNYSLV
ncbi:DNA-protecting protein DprA [Candidatus Fermentibacteria bacterium]|nr:DNA-protecting protein DprA [Candidatus Fermentibacteria bacterium]